MPIRYVTKREQTSKFIEDVVIPLVKSRDLDYEKLVAWITSKIFANPKLVREILDGFADMGKLKKEDNVLTIPDKDIIEFLKDTKGASQAEVIKILDYGNRSGETADNPKL